MKKILFIMHMPPPVHGASMVGEYIHNSLLINKEFECKYINPSASRKVTEVGKVSFGKLVFLFRLLMKIRKEIKLWKPDLVYYTPTADGWGIYRDMLTIVMMRSLGAKIILHMHNKGVKNFSHSRTASYAYREIFKKNKVIQLADVLYQDIEEYVECQDVFVLPNGVTSTLSDEEYAKVINERKHRKSVCSFLYLSNLIIEKGILVLLEACKVLKRKGIAFECHFVGNSGDVVIDDFRKMVAQEGLSDCVFVDGPKYGDEKAPFMCNADAFVFPTYYHGECFPLVLLEAMEYGLPCISTYEGGIPAIIEEGKTGLMVMQNDVDALASKMQWMVENRSNAFEMGIAGRNRFEELFVLDRFEIGLKSIFDKMLKIN